MAIKVPRREFLAGAAAAGFSSALHLPAPQRLPLAFSTLGCPAWELTKILDFGGEHGFAAIELRGLMGTMDLPARPEFSADQLEATKKSFAAHGLKIACVSSSAALHESDAAKRTKEFGDAKRFIDLAAALGAPYVRVFGNEIHGSRENAVARVAAGLKELGSYAGERGVAVLLESHGDFTDSPTLKEILLRADSPHAGLLWDAHHTFASGHEQPETTVRELGRWIRHTHLKDSEMRNGERHYVLTGRGDVPVERQIDSLARIGYTGYFCFEWERVWHPELADPEIAIADYARVAGGYLRKTKRYG
jgi:sugar phosphate isomerase/epimerase